MNCKHFYGWLILIKVLEYQSKLRAVTPNVHFLMSLYVSFAYLSVQGGTQLTKV